MVRAKRRNRSRRRRSAPSGVCRAMPCAANSPATNASSAPPTPPASPAAQTPSTVVRCRSSRTSAQVPSGVRWVAQPRPVASSSCGTSPCPTASASHGIRSRVPGRGRQVPVETGQGDGLDPVGAVHGGDRAVGTDADAVAEQSGRVTGPFGELAGVGGQRARGAGVSGVAADLGDDRHRGTGRRQRSGNGQQRRPAARDHDPPPRQHQPRLEHGASEANRPAQVPAAFTTAGARRSPRGVRTPRTTPPGPRRTAVTSAPRCSRAPEARSRWAAARAGWTCASCG